MQSNQYDWRLPPPPGSADSWLIAVTDSVINIFRRGLEAVGDVLDRLFRWRRDVRHFRSDPVDATLLARLVETACLAPSVGHSQPWRFVSVEDAGRRAAVREDFLRCNRAALADYEDERAALYARLKLEGLDQAPVQLAVFADEATEAYSVLSDAQKRSIYDRYGHAAFENSCSW